LALGAEGGVSRYDGLSSKTYNIGLNASWEIDIFGRLTAAKRGATAAAVSVEEQAQAIKTQLVATIAGTYYSLLMLDRQIEIAKSTLDNWTETIRVMELLKTAGMANEAGILQTRANRVGLQSDIIAMENSRREIENSLCSLLAQPPHSIIRGKIADVAFNDNLSVGLPLQLLANRPDVRAAEMELARTHYAVGEARASFYPSLTLGGTKGFTNNGGVIVNPGQLLLNAVGQLVQPIFNRGQLKANYKIAEAEREIAKLQFNQVLLDAGKEVNNSLADISSARERLKLVGEQITLLEDAVKKTELLMRHSPVNYLEVLTAQQSLLSAQQAEVQCRYDEISGIISLYHALGGGKRN
jgi:NodT family efflux transporter outer membrane factor (OMF) lipoprotein